MLKKGSTLNLSIKMKLLFIFVVILLILGIMNILTLRNSVKNNDNLINVFSKFNNQYNEVLDNMVVASKVKDNVLEINKKIKDINQGMVKPEEVSFDEELTETEGEIKKLKDNAVGEDSKTSAESIEIQFISLKLYINDFLESKKDGDEEKAQKIVQEIGQFFISKINDDVQRYILAETNNLSTISKEINKSFNEKEIEVKEYFSKSLRKNIILLSIIFVSSLLVTYFIVNKISNPIRRLSRTAETVATGNLNIEKFEVKTSDEVNVLSTAFNKMIDNLRELVAKINTASKEITNVSDITYNNSEQNTAAAVEIGNSVNKMVDGINAEKQKTVGTLENSISMYSISKNIKDESFKILENTLKSVELANDGQLSMDKFNKQLGIINKSFSEVYKFSEILNNRTQNMGKILEVINDISNQTKLLSINALIESAKAGEKGFGFNVVAKEIKKLSENTRISTSKINEIIKAIQNETLILSEKVSNNLEQLNIGNSISQDVIKYFEKIKGSNKLINKDVSKSSKELENLIDNIGNVNKNMDDISLTIDNNLEFITNISASVQEQTACSQEVSGSAAIMNNLIVDLNELIFKFKV